MRATARIMSQAPNGDLTLITLKADGNGLRQLDLLRAAIRQIIQKRGQGMVGVQKHKPRLALPMMGFKGLPAHAFDQMTNHVAGGVQACVLQAVRPVYLLFYWAQGQALMQVMQHMAVTVLSDMQNLVTI